MRAKHVLLEKLATVLQDMGFEVPAKLTVEPPKDPKFGDLATNAAMLLAKEAKKPPRELAEAIKERIAATSGEIEHIDVAGPGFLNFFFTQSFWQGLVSQVQEEADEFGTSSLGRGKRVQVEFVSANPTGPLHIGHGRGAAVGDSLARILRFTGHEVSTEYYINDAGRQMRILGMSLLTRCREVSGMEVEIPDDFYKGEYITDMARDLLEEKGSELIDMPDEEALQICRQYGMDRILAGIRTDLEDFRVHHDVWFSEQTLLDSGEVDQTLGNLQKSELAYMEEGALWFRSTQFGDDKDRVLRKSDGLLTYFASDIAYHANKYERGFDLVVDIWGADHHGYVPRMKAAVQALGQDKDDLGVILVQLVNLLRAGEQVAMSTRAGEFETLADVCAEVGVDAARFIFLSRKSDSHLDFDLEVVKQQTMENPVYYVQYAHARINSLLTKAQERDVAVLPLEDRFLTRLDTPEDINLLKQLDQFPDVVQSAASTLNPHFVSFYLQNLAANLHRYYTTHPVLSLDDPELIQARIHLLLSVSQVLRNGLGLLGVSAPERM